MRRSAVVSVVALALMLGLASSPARSQAAVSSPGPGDQGDPTTSGWALTTTTFDNAYTRHAYVGNGYLSQRVPATGTGYVELRGEDRKEQFLGLFLSDNEAEAMLDEMSGRLEAQGGGLPSLDDVIEAWHDHAALRRAQAQGIWARMARASISTARTNTSPSAT